MTEKTIISVGDLNVRVSSETSDEINNLLSSTIVGSEGGVQYTMRNIAARIANYGKTIRLISVHLRSSLVAVIGTCYRDCSLGDLAYPSTYLRFLSFRPQYQTARFMPGLRKNTTGIDKDDSFKSRTLRLFGMPHILEYDGVNEKSPHLLYCFVEGKNERSQNLIRQAGFEYLRSFNTIAFSRFNPKSDPRVTLAMPQEHKEVLEYLREFYKGYSFYFEQFAFHDNSYYVVRENGRIIAGVSAIPTEYVLHDVPGAGGWIMMNILPFAPFFKRLFNPGLFRFLSLGYIFHLPGREDALAPLFESVCAAKKINTALTWADGGSDLYRTITEKISLGTLNTIFKTKPGLFFARFINYREEDKNPFHASPAFISGFDFT